MSGSWIQELREALEVDLVLSLSQVERRWRAEVPPRREDLEKALREEGFFLTSRYLTGTNRSRTYLLPTFVAINRRVATFPGILLRHLAGVAEMRYRLGVEGSSWRLYTYRVKGVERPDAVWYREGEPWAVEYDVGYTRMTVLHKVRTFRHLFAGQVWGVATPGRMQYLTGLLPKDRSAHVTLAPWV